MARGGPSFSDEDEAFLAAVRGLGRERVRGALGSEGTAGAIEQFPGFRIEREVHRGGQGAVYEAVQLSTKRRVALKTLLRGELSSPEERRRFEREIELVSRLRHPNIVVLFEGGTGSRGSEYFAMEYVDGERLDVALDCAGPDDALGTKDGRLDLFEKVAEAIQYAHDNGIVHRDLKPANVLVDERGEPRVLDFGLAKKVGHRSSWESELTTAGGFMGSLAWAAPEQLRGDVGSVGPATDVHGLGLLLYRLLCGGRPFESEGTMLALAHAILESPPRSLVARPTSVPVDGDLEAVVFHALKKRPGERYPSAASMLEDVRAYRQGLPVRARGDSGAYRLQLRLRRYRGLAGALVALLALAAVLVHSWRRDALAAEEDRHAASLERGRLLLEADNMLEAERVLWREHSIASAGPPGEGLGRPPSAPEGDRARPEPMLSWWALRSFYHRNPCVRTAVLSPDAVYDDLAAHRDRLVASTAEDRPIAAWRLPRLERLLTYADSASFRHLALLGQGELLAAVGTTPDTEGTVRLWDARRGTVVRDLAVPGVQRIESVPGDRSLLVQSPGRVRWLDVDGHVRWSRETGLGHPRGVALAPDHVQVVIAAARGMLWTTTQAREEGSTLDRTFGGTSPVFSPDGRWLYCSELVRVADGSREFDFTRHSGTARRRAGAFLGERLVATGGPRNSLLVGRLGRGELEALWGGHRAPLREVVSAPDGGRVVSVDSTGVARVWEPCDPYDCVPPDVSTVLGAGVSADGTRLVLAFDSHTRKGRSEEPGTGGAAFVDLARPEVPRTFGCGHVVADAEFDPDGQTVTTACYAGELLRWEVGDCGTPCWEGPPNPGKYFDLTLSPDGRWMGVARSPGPALVLDLSDLGAEGAVREVSSESAMRVASTAWSADSGRLAWSGSGGRVGVVAWPENRVLLDAGVSKATLHAVCFGRGPDELFLGSWSGELLRVDVSDGTARRAADFGSPVLALVASDEGELVWCGTRAGTVHVYSSALGRSIASFPVGDRGIFDLSFHAETQRLVYSGELRLIGVLDLPELDAAIRGNEAFGRSEAAREP